MGVDSKWDMHTHTPLLNDKRGGGGEGRGGGEKLD